MHKASRKSAESNDVHAHVRAHSVRVSLGLSEQSGHTQCQCVHKQALKYTVHCKGSSQFAACAHHKYRKHAPSHNEGALFACMQLIVDENTALCMLY